MKSQQFFGFKAEILVGAALIKAVCFILEIVCWGASEKNM